ncbi:MAG: hypothetical protein ACR2IE_00785 [Candidatus Sumerlaeaceae bacterium]
MRRAFTILLLLAALSSHANQNYVGYLSDSKRASTATVIASDVPFLKQNLWTGTTEGQSLKLEVGPVTADYLYILGGLNSDDRANPDWGGGSSYANLFIGDVAGTVTLTYVDQTRDSIPLVFGYNLFWRLPFEHSYEPFQIDAHAMQVLDSALCLANGTTHSQELVRFIPVSLREQPLQSIEFQDEASKKGYPVVDGITFQLSAAHLISANNKLQTLSGARSRQFTDWLKTHEIRSEEPYPARRRDAVQKLARMLYTYPQDVTTATVAQTPCAVSETSFKGPKISFAGPAEADILTNIYFENAHEMSGRVEPTGMVHESEQHADYYGGFGGWRPDVHAFWDASYTRNRLLIGLANLGYTEKVDRALRFYDHWLMYFPLSYPGLQLAGKPVPGHWTVVANKPHLYFDTLRAVGWKTKFQTRDFGNPESDGHGLLMLSHWKQWVKMGRPPEWVRQRWAEIREAAEYIPWHLDNPQLSFSEHGLMYSESEGGMLKPSLYCDLPCYLGLVSYADMADACGETTSGLRWRDRARRLADAMERYYPLSDPQWGAVWDPHKGADFIGGYSILAPVNIGADYYGYDVVEQLPPGWAQRTRNSYRMQLARNEPRWCAPAGLGYAQCAVAQTALLFDEMADAEKLVSWLARFCFHPRLKHPYRVPEGVTMASDGSVWRRWGDLGNLFQLTDTIYTMNTMAGIDDTDPDVLKLLPRLPRTWTGITIRDYPVQARSAGKLQRIPFQARVSMNPDGTSATLVAKADSQLDNCLVRIGPFSSRADNLNATLDGIPVSIKGIRSGDSLWGELSVSNRADFTLHAHVIF